VVKPRYSIGKPDGQQPLSEIGLPACHGTKQTTPARPELGGNHAPERGRSRWGITRRGRPTQRRVSCTHSTRRWRKVDARVSRGNL